MEAFIVYILKASAVLAAFYLLWRFTLRGKTLHAESRVYLLVTMAFSFVVPLLVLTLTRTVELPTGTVSAGDPVLFDTQPAPNVGTVSVWGVLSVLYCVGAVAVLLYNIYAVASVRRLISSSSDAVLPDGTEVKVSSKVKVPFSFFSTMVVPENDMPSPDRALVTHEKAHVRLGHSADIQLCGAVCALQWFNPFVWLLRKDLRSIHEFQADAAVIDSGVRVTDYQIFLVEEVLSSGGYPLVSNLTSGNLKNRIDMMNASISSRRPLARLLLVVPLFAACLLANSRTKVVYVEPQGIQQSPQNDGSVPFQMVEVKPTFDGGDANKFSMWVNSQLVYPKEAKDNNIQGRVTLQFTVGKDGSVYGVKVLRGAHELLDNEAVRVVSASPKWSPGKMKGEPVAVTYTFPVIFQLKGDASEAPAGGIGIVKKDPGAPDPVIYLDGNKYEGNLSTIDPNTIESVTVLKDEAALRQYDAPGGVILITTKETAKDSSGNTPFQMVEQKPTFGGGDASEFSKWVTSNLKYPEEAKAAKVQGRVTVTFVVDIDGSVKDVKVLRGVNELLDAEAVRVVSASPKWTPGRSKGNPVPVTYTFPVIFKLD
jgi:TonB family protein